MLLSIINNNIIFDKYSYYNKTVHYSEFLVILIFIIKLLNRKLDKHIKPVGQFVFKIVSNVVPAKKKEKTAVYAILSNIELNKYFFRDTKDDLISIKVFFINMNTEYCTINQRLIFSNVSCRQLYPCINYFYFYIGILVSLFLLEAEMSVRQLRQGEFSRTLFKKEV